MLNHNDEAIGCLTLLGTFKMTAFLAIYIMNIIWYLVIYSPQLFRLSYQKSRDMEVGAANPQRPLTHAEQVRCTEHKYGLKLT